MAIRDKAFIVKALLATSIVSISSVSLATPVQWTLSDVAYGDGGTASGSFIYDADSATFSAISIATTAGLDAPAAYYDTVLISESPYDLALTQSGALDLTGAPLLQLLFQAPLGNAGGAISLVDQFYPAFSSSEGECLDAVCSSAGLLRLMVDGGVTGTVVPLPPAVLLFSAAVAMMGFARRTQA